MSDPPLPSGPSVQLSHRAALRFIVLLGGVSLLADMTYEGARSITGPYLALLGASATAVGFVAGFGELIGYAVRLASGWLSDRTGRYWAVTIFGYAINLLAVPLLALAGSWQAAAVLIVLERMGRAIRTPARDAMLSHAAGRTGLGWGFGLHEALDQIGAVIGPLALGAVLYLGGDYRMASRPSARSWRRRSRSWAARRPRSPACALGQESVMRAAIARMAPVERRGTATACSTRSTASPGSPAACSWGRRWTTARSSAW